jgi:hypothetical protein
MPDPQDQPEHRPDAAAEPVDAPGPAETPGPAEAPEPAEPGRPAKKVPAKKASAKDPKKTPAKKASKNGPAKKAAKKSPAKKAAGKKAPAKAPQPAGNNDSRRLAAGAKDAAAQAKSTVDAADGPVAPPQLPLTEPDTGRSPAVLLSAATLGLLLTLLVVRQLRRRTR